MDENKKEISMEELTKAAGGFMPTCFHPKLSEYFGKTKESFGEKLYLWKCAKCGSEIWVKNVPKTGGATGTW